jgi:hypothetical protein
MPRRGSSATIEAGSENGGAAMTTGQLLGLSEEELRDELTRELLLAIRVEGDAPTVHAIAHAIARVLELDHLRIADQLERAGVRLDGSDVD